MIATILFSVLLVGLGVVGVQILAGYEPKHSRALVVAKEKIRFEDFCGMKCRCRYVCMKKEYARRNGTCYNYEADTNALW
jgi:hypothetical protein